MATVPVLVTGAVKAVPEAFPAGQAVAGEVLVPRMRAAGVTVKLVVAGTPGLGTVLFGVRMTGSSRALARTGAAGASIVMPSTNRRRTAAAPRPGTAGGGAGAGTGGTTGAGGAGAEVEMTVRTSCLRASVVTVSLIKRSQSLEEATARCSSAVSRIDVRRTPAKNAGYRTSLTGAPKAVNIARRFAMFAEFSRFHPSGAEYRLIGSRVPTRLIEYARRSMGLSSRTLSKMCRARWFLGPRLSRLGSNSGDRELYGATSHRALNSARYCS